MHMNDYNQDTRQILLIYIYGLPYLFQNNLHSNSECHTVVAEAEEQHN